MRGITLDSSILTISYQKPPVLHRAKEKCNIFSYAFHDEPSFCSGVDITLKHVVLSFYVSHMAVLGSKYGNDESGAIAFEKVLHSADHSAAIGKRRRDMHRESFRGAGGRS